MQQCHLALNALPLSCSQMRLVIAHAKGPARIRALQVYGTHGTAKVAKAARRQHEQQAFCEPAGSPRISAPPEHLRLALAAVDHKSEALRIYHSTSLECLHLAPAAARHCTSHARRSAPSKHMHLAPAAARHPSIYTSHPPQRVTQACTSHATATCHSNIYASHNHYSTQQGQTLNARRPILVTHKASF